ncbi:LysR substrate-binding domain-containing protein [Ensifer sp. YR511]|uniref:LysR substrate-binding domain-containing protein n=1 Tax=Ensifer sp. YR511 TaxID=1855294 RepID=UPI00088B8B01|nr:LysR substrate-binding domain-containing protein [Ensifer sp. YR511]SDN41911.1 DNA-binding transcriptional regulator, LysR family [Ensifer sp. YR511]
MDVAQLKTLIHVAEVGSLSKAADRLNIAQPALSRQIRLLERELGTFLFNRHGRGMVITDAGREVLEHATRVMIELEAIRDITSGGKASYQGMVVMGMTPTVAEIMTVPLVSEIKKAHPKLAIRILSAFSGHLMDWLQRGEVELAVSYNPESLRSLRIRPIMMENLMYVSADAEHPLSLDVPVQFARLAEAEMVLPSPRHGLRVIVEECADQAGVALKTSVEADSFGAMINLVRNGFGSTILPLAPIYSLVKSGRLSAAPLVDPTPTRKLVVAYPADRPVSPAARFVAETFTEIASDFVARNVWSGHIL